MKIKWIFQGEVPLERQAVNIAANQGKGQPLGSAWPVLPRVAVVGGDPWVKSRLDELRDFDGDIWAINGTYGLLTRHAIDCAFFSIEAHPCLADLAAGATRALIASACDPKTFAALAPDALLETFGVGPDAVVHGPTTATCAPHLAALRGHHKVAFYGCASCFDGRTTHAYYSENLSRIEVETTSGKFITRPDMLGQAEWLANLITLLPDIYEDRSGGLLAALIKCPDYDVTAATRHIHEALIPA